MTLFELAKCFGKKVVDCSLIVVSSACLNGFFYHLPQFGLENGFEVVPVGFYFMH